MKKPNTSTMTPDEMRKLAAELHERADREEGRLLLAKLPSQIDALTKKYVGTAWIKAPQSRPVKRMWIVKIDGFYQEKNSFCINYTYQTLILTRSHSETSVEVLPHGTAAWFKSTDMSLTTAISPALFNEYAQVAKNTSAKAFRTIKALVPEYFVSPKTQPQKLFPKVKKPR